jgi:hypothetical protein
MHFEARSNHQTALESVNIRKEGESWSGAHALMHKIRLFRGQIDNLGVNIGLNLERGLGDIFPSGVLSPRWHH